MTDSLLFIIPTLDRGGAETQVLELAKGHQRRGRDVAVVSLLPGGALAPAFKAAGIPVDDLGMRRGTADPRAITRLARLIRARGPGIVHAHMVHANLLSRLARPLAPQRLLVNTAHSVDEEGRGRELAYRATAPLCDVMTNVSAGGTERYRQLGLAPGRSLLHLPNGIDVGRFVVADVVRAETRRALGIEDGTWLWLAVGRLEVPKDPVTLIRAFAASAGQDEVLLIAGSGSLARDAERAISDAGLTDRVRLLGERDDVPALLAAADAVVLSSRWEGHPMVVLEAAAAGKVIVATGAPGIVDVVEDDVTGFLATPADPDALGRAMARVRSMPDAARLRVIAAARRRLEDRYTLDTILDRWDGVYRDRIAPAPRRMARG